MLHHIKYSDAERELAGAARQTAMNRDVLYHGTRYPKLILRTGVLFRAEGGGKTVCFSRSPEVAAYWALLERDDDEARGAILVFDRRSLERRYEIKSVPGPYWHSDKLFHDEAEEEIWDDVVEIVGRHLIGFVSSPKGRTASRLPAHLRRRLGKTRYREFRKQIEARVLKLSPPNPKPSRHDLATQHTRSQCGLPSDKVKRLHTRAVSVKSCHLQIRKPKRPSTTAAAPGNNECPGHGSPVLIDWRDFDPLHAG